MADESLHRKRLAQILRYIAGMHQTLHSTDEACEHSFTKDARNNTLGGESDFFQNEAEEEGGEMRRCGVLFSTSNFRRLLALENNDDSILFQSSPFSFYAASSASTSPRKRTFTGAFKSQGMGSSQSNSSSMGGKGYWLRIVRLKPSQIPPKPKISHSSIQRYLENWLHQSVDANSLEDLLTLNRMNMAPKLPPSASAGEKRQVSQFLRKYKRYLRVQSYQRTLEPIYNKLFEWVQQQQDHNEELVWSLGHARVTSDTVCVNGPLLDVLVEVELAPDGALLVRPREHTGVTLNRQVVSALSSAGADMGTPLGHSVLVPLHRSVGELEPTNFSPAQPTTYTSILKRIAVELSSGGSFQQSATVRSPRRNKLVVTEAWCVYSRLKPSSVWARDANTLADQLMLPTATELPMPDAAWSLTFGPNALEDVLKEKISTSEKEKSGFDILKWFQKKLSKQDEEPDQDIKRPIFPLATSDSQNRIADLLLNKNYPAVVAEGPPGSGKTHTIANVVCAYLCQGKRVLVTSKNSPALSVLRGRLPKSVQELCVDVSMSESSGMRQLQQTVERLANRVSVASVEVESEKCNLLQRNINGMEEKIQEIEGKIYSESDKIRTLLQSPDGESLSSICTTLIETSPWLMKSLQEKTSEELSVILNQLQGLKISNNDPLLKVEGFVTPPKNALMSAVSAKAGSSVSSFKNASRNLVSSLPILGNLSGYDSIQQEISDALLEIRIGNNIPRSEEEWKTVSNALEHAQRIHFFQENTWKPTVREYGWPDLNFSDQQTLEEVIKALGNAIQAKKLIVQLNASERLLQAAECRKLDAQRGKIVSQVKHCSAELVDAAVVAELSRSFSPEAQSALIRFAQIAGAAKFNKSSKPSKMTQRQRRRRQDYLDAFDRCCRFIPCWILTTSQISDYLPPECIFDLVVIDESSQSDITVLPGMLRGKQWLIVGDGKQVSPTEAFVSEEEIDNLRSSLPPSPLGNSLLPGNSFFDMCAQAFPRGRVVLSEHFRCAPEIIAFSNEQFYDDRLVPLRMPTKSERLKPSLVDMKVNGIKRGKINEVEAEKIVEMIEEAMSIRNGEKPRTIGVISLIGNDQSRLIRGRLLDVVGPERMARHEVLIGDPPTFQGAERDIVFLSMVCSRGSVPTQSQLMHFQRANVAMSRAKDRCVLVRSIDLTDIPSLEDMKVPMIEFFMNSSTATGQDEGPDNERSEACRKGASALKQILLDRCYSCTDMGVIWKHAICVEDSKGEIRASLLIDCEGMSSQEWKASYIQQKAIERVGWKCLRVDALSFFIDFEVVMQTVMGFLKAVGIEPGAKREIKNDIQVETSTVTGMEIELQNSDGDSERKSIHIEDENSSHDVVTISSDDSVEDSKPAALYPDRVQSSTTIDDTDEINAGRFGRVVGLDFLAGPEPSEEVEVEVEESLPHRMDLRSDSETQSVANNRDRDNQVSKTSAAILNVEDSDNGSVRSKEASNDVEEIEPLNDTEAIAKVETIARRPAVQESDNVASKALPQPIDNTREISIDMESSGEACSVRSSRSKRRKYRRLDRYSRDGRWYPGRDSKAYESDKEWHYDTDSDLPKNNMSEDSDDEIEAWVPSDQVKREEKS